MVATCTATRLTKIYDNIPLSIYKNFNNLWLNNSDSITLSLTFSIFSKLKYVVTFLFLIFLLIKKVIIVLLGQPIKSECGPNFLKQR